MGSVFILPFYHFFFVLLVLDLVLGILLLLVTSLGHHWFVVRFRLAASFFLYWLFVCVRISILVLLSFLLRLIFILLVVRFLRFCSSVWLLNVDLSVDVFKPSRHICRSSFLVSWSEKQIKRRVDQRWALWTTHVLNGWHTEHVCVFLRTTSAPSWVEWDQGLSIRSLSMLVLHMGVERGIAQVSFVTIRALMVSSLAVILWSSLLFWFRVRIVLLGRIVDKTIWVLFAIVSLRIAFHILRGPIVWAPLHLFPYNNLERMVEITREMLRKRAEHNEGMLSTLEEVTLHQ